MKILELSKGYKTLIDDSDFEWISEYRWKATETSPTKVYAMRNAWIGNGKRKGLYLHRMIMQAPNSRNFKVRKNNTSGATGVYFNKRISKWIAYINNSKSPGRTMTYLGCFTTKEEAIDVRNSATVRLFGEFGNLAAFPERNGSTDLPNVSSQGS